MRDNDFSGLGLFLDTLACIGGTMPGVAESLGPPGHPFFPVSKFPVTWKRCAAASPVSFAQGLTVLRVVVEPLLDGFISYQEPKPSRFIRINCPLHERRRSKIALRYRGRHPAANMLPGFEDWLRICGLRYVLFRRI